MLLLPLLLRAVLCTLCALGHARTHDETDGAHSSNAEGVTKCC
jgi:hypothetical protein